MTKRRRFLLSLTVCFVATGFVVATVLADELIGVITKVDVDAKKITVVEKDSDKEVVLKINDDTVQVTKKGESKVDLEKLDTILKKVQEKGKKGINATITHEKGVASKIQPKFGFGKKKAE